MAVTIESRYSKSIHPLHAVSLAGTVPLFLGAALGRYRVRIHVRNPVEQLCILADRRGSCLWRYRAALRDH